MENDIKEAKKQRILQDIEAAIDDDEIVIFKLNDRVKVYKQEEFEPSALREIAGLIINVLRIIKVDKTVRNLVVKLLLTAVAHREEQIPTPPEEDIKQQLIKELND